MKQSVFRLSVEEQSCNITEHKTDQMTWQRQVLDQLSNLGARFPNLINNMKTWIDGR